MTNLNNKGKSIDPKNTLEVHTYYRYKGDLGGNQLFKTSKFSKNILYMPRFNVCVQVNHYNIESKVNLDTKLGRRGMTKYLIKDLTLQNVVKITLSSKNGQ